MHDLVNCRFLSGLQSQRQLIVELIDKELHIVYCYLRWKDSGTAPKGTPYYFGLASRAKRPYESHEWISRDGRKRKIPLPPSESLIRVVAALPTRELAATRERFFIARYGRRCHGEGILINSSAGGEPGGLGNRVPSRRIREWYLVKNAAANAGVTPRVWMQISLTQKAAWRSYLGRNPGLQISIATYLETIYRTYDESRMRTGWQELGASEEEWKVLSRRQRKTAIERFDKGLPWNEDGRRNQSPAVISNRLERSAATRIARGAERLGMTVEQYCSISSSKRSDIKKWLQQHPGQTWEERPKGGEQIPKGIENKRLIAAAAKYGINLSLYASLSDRDRRLLRRRYSSGKRGKELLRGLGT